LDNKHREEDVVADAVLARAKVFADEVKHKGPEDEVVLPRPKHHKSSIMCCLSCNRLDQLLAWIKARLGDDFISIVKEAKTAAIFTVGDSARTSVGEVMRAFYQQVGYRSVLLCYNKGATEEQQDFFLKEGITSSYDNRLVIGSDD
jgi:hypothetical protein